MPTSKIHLKQKGSLGKGSYSRVVSAVVKENPSKNPFIRFTKYRTLEPNCVYRRKPLPGTFVAIKESKKGNPTETTRDYNSHAEALNLLFNLGLTENNLPIPNLICKGDTFYIMEQIEGQTLEKYIFSGKKSIYKIAGFMKSIAQALETFHLTGCAHLDLKPLNIMVNEKTGKVTLIDFAAIKFGTLLKSCILTEDFAAPEIYSNLKVTPKSDIYSLGKIFEAIQITQRLYIHELFQLVDDMTNLDYKKRPCLSDIISNLDTIFMTRIRTHEIAERTQAPLTLNNAVTPSVNSGNGSQLSQHKNSLTILGLTHTDVFLSTVTATQTRPLQSLANFRALPQTLPH